jgi:hypothetical protein
MHHVFDATPHAVFWRPIRYFSTYVRRDVDDLDEYEVASFDYGNQFSFDLRWYRGHPAFTVSLYLPANFGNYFMVVRTVSELITELRVPRRAVAWRRGQRFRFGELSRAETDRLREPEARILALKIAAKKQGREASTSEIKRELPRIYPLSELDLVPSKTRRREQHWQQIVGNVISHINTPNSVFVQGYAVRTLNGLRVTQEGVDYLNNMGFDV